MAKKNGSTFVTDDLESQRTYVKQRRDEGFAFPLIATESFVRGMRDSGYKSTATAIDEFIDNSIQAQAEYIDVLFTRTAGKDRLTLENNGKIAVVDNGHGMDPDMIRMAVIWGGTHRENDRTGFGRYGFGLPSAAVSVSRSFEVYSKVSGSEWYMVRIDLEAIARGELRTNAGVVEAPKAVVANLPDWISATLPKGGLDHGTIVVLDQCDRLSPGYVNVSTFEQNMLHHLGLTYRDVLRRVRVRVIDVAENNKTTVVEPIDPLFLREDARFYDENNVRAEALPPAEILVKDKNAKGKTAGTLRVRYSWMKPEFMSRDTNRMKVRKENTGMIVMRAGRQVDVIDKFPSEWGLSLQHNDRYWAVELDFDPSLDEYFTVTTNKQQIHLIEGMLTILKENGVLRAIKEMRAKFKLAKGEDDAVKQPETKRTEKVAADTLKFRKRRTPQSPAKERRSKENLESEITRVSEKTGKTPEEVKPQVEQDATQRPYKIEYEGLQGAPFYRMAQIGAQKRLYINTAHRFYSDLYNAPTTTRRVQEGLELMLITFGECEIEAPDEREQFYRMERNEWSRVLDTMLEALDREDPLVDRIAAKAAEEEEVAADAAAATA